MQITHNILSVGVEHMAASDCTEVRDWWIGAVQSFHGLKHTYTHCFEVDL